MLRYYLIGTSADTVEEFIGSDLLGAFSHARVRRFGSATLTCFGSRPA
jgi:hypothetical protein